MNKTTKISEIMKEKWKALIRRGRPQSEYLQCSRKYWSADIEGYLVCRRAVNRFDRHCDWCEERLHIKKPRCDIQRFYPNKYNPEVVIDIML